MHKEKIDRYRYPAGPCCSCCWPCSSARAGRWSPPWSGAAPPASSAVRWAWWPASSSCRGCSWSIRTRRSRCCCSATTRAPNAASGLRYTNPFFTKMKISLKARNLNGERLKVNDLSGNPIEIAAVVVWRVAGHGRGAVRRRQLRGVRRRSRASRRCGTWPAPTPTTPARTEVSLRGATDDDQRAPAARAAGAPGQGRRRGDGGPAGPPGLRAGDRARDAPAPAGQRRDRRPQEDRRRRRRHGRDGAAGTGRSQTWSTWTRSARPPWSATCWWSCAANTPRSRS